MEYEDSAVNAGVVYGAISLGSAVTRYGSEVKTGWGGTCWHGEKEAGGNSRAY